MDGDFSYSSALIFSSFKSTHILRKAMANIVRQEIGLEAALTAVGLKSSKKVVEHIGKLLVDGEEQPRLVLDCEFHRLLGSIRSRDKNEESKVIYSVWSGHYIVCNSINRRRKYL